MSRPDFRAVAARRLSEDRELSPAIVSLISPDKTDRTLVRQIPVDKITPNPNQPRLLFEQSSLDELTASIKEHGVLQPILVRPVLNGFQLIAGERRWRASKAAGLPTVPALIEEMDDEAAMEVAIIENLQRDDLTPLDESLMYARMIREHGYSVRKLATKLGKDKGYLENRLRLADAPEEIKQLVSLRKDTLSHAYELMKVTDTTRRRRLAEEVVREDLSLVALRARIAGRPARVAQPADGEAPRGGRRGRRVAAVADPAPEATAAAVPVPAPAVAADPVALDGDDALVLVKAQLDGALDAVGSLVRAPHVLAAIDPVDRANLAKYLTIAKLKLENTIAIVRTGDADR
ncbi:MAG: hypothetical protein RL338_124 [Chloroflexota bacterium]